VVKFFFPNGRVTRFEIYYGDGTTEQLMLILEKQYRTFIKKVYMKLNSCGYIKRKEPKLQKTVTVFKLQNLAVEIVKGSNLLFLRRQLCALLPSILWDVTDEVPTDFMEVT
jgi:hypothetical protein